MTHAARAQGLLTEQLAFAGLLTMLGVAHEAPTLVVLGALASPLARTLFGLADAARVVAARDALVAAAWSATIGGVAFGAASVGSLLAPAGGAPVLAELPAPVPLAHAAVVVATMSLATSLLRRGHLAAAAPFLVLSGGALAYPIALAGALPLPAGQDASRAALWLAAELALLALGTAWVTLSRGARPRAASTYGGHTR